MSAISFFVRCCNIRLILPNNSRTPRRHILAVEMISIPYNWLKPKDDIPENSQSLLTVTKKGEKKTGNKTRSQFYFIMPPTLHKSFAYLPLQRPMICNVASSFISFNPSSISVGLFPLNHEIDSKSFPSPISVVGKPQL